MPAEGLVGGAPQPILALPGLTRCNRCCPKAEQLADVFGVDDRVPVGLRVLRETCVFEPALVVVGDPSI